MADLTNNLAFWLAMRAREKALKDARGDLGEDLPGYVIGTRNGKLVWGYLETPEDRHQKRRRLAWKSVLTLLRFCAGRCREVG